MLFVIRFLNQYCEMEHVVDVPRPAAKGQIQLGEFREDFYSMLEVWQCADYERQWEDARERLRRGAYNSCFVVGVHPPEIAQFIECWILWRLKNEYRVQNQSLFFDRVGQVDPLTPYDAIWPYHNVTEDGERIDDDWGMPLDTFSGQ